MHCEPAASVIARLGGLSRVAIVCDLHISTVQRWRMAKAKGGTGGVIPAKYMPVLLREAEHASINITAKDMIPFEHEVPPSAHGNQSSHLSHQDTAANGAAEFSGEVPRG